MTKGYMFGPQTAKRVLRLTGAADGTYDPSEVKPYASAEEGASSGLAKSPVGGIPAQTGDVPGVAMCTPAELYDDAGTIKIRVISGAATVPIYNTTSIASKSEKWIHWKTDSGRKIIDVDDCNAGGGTTTINGGTP